MKAFFQSIEDAESKYKQLMESFVDSMKTP